MNIFDEVLNIEISPYSLEIIPAIGVFQFEPSPYKAKSKSIPKSKGSRQNQIVSKTAFT